MAVTIAPSVRLGRGHAGPRIQPVAYLAPRPLPAWALPTGINPEDVVAVWEPFGARSMADSFINLANPGVYAAIPHLRTLQWNPTDGFVGDGNQYYRSGLVPVCDRTWSFLAWATDMPTTEGQYNALFGVHHTSAFNRTINITRRLGTLYFHNGGELALTNNAVTGGVFAVAGDQAYIDGVNVGALTPQTLEANSREMGIGTYINIANGMGTSGLIGKLKAVAVWNHTLSQAQVAAITSALQADEANWWLAGDVDPTWPVAVWQWVGAASEQAARINLVAPGTYTLQPPSPHNLHWSASTGWTNPKATQDAFAVLRTGLVPQGNRTWSFMLHQHVPAGDSFNSWGMLDLAVSRGVAAWRIGTYVYFYNSILRYVNIGTAVDVKTIGLAGSSSYYNGNVVHNDNNTDHVLTGDLGLMGAHNSNLYPNYTGGGSDSRFYRLAAWNKALSDAQMAEVHALMLAAGPFAPTGATVQGAAQIVQGVAAVYNATVEPANATGPFTYLWQATGLPDQTKRTAAFTWDTPGTKTVAVTVTSPHGSAQGTLPVEVGLALAGATIIAPGEATTGQSAEFSVTVAPVGTLPPTSYLWQTDELDDQTTAVAHFVWDTLGTKTVTVTVSDGYSSVTATTQVEVARGLPAWATPAGITTDDLVGYWTGQWASSLEESLVNLANPGVHDLTVCDPAPTWDANGFHFDYWHYLKTGIAPGLVDRTWTLLVWVVESPASPPGWSGFIGTHPAALTQGLNIMRSGATIYFCNSSNRNYAGAAFTAGTLCVAGDTAYVNGSSIGTIAGLNPDQQDYDIYIGAVNYLGTAPLNHCRGTTIGGAAIYNTALSAAQVAALHSALLANDANWWLAGGVAPSACLGAYRFKDAASREAALTNLVNPALPLTVESNGAVLDPAGWAHREDRVCGLFSDYTPPLDQSISFLIYATTLSALTSTALAWGIAGDDWVSGVQVIQYKTGIFLNNGGRANTGGTMTGTHAIGVAGNRAFFDGELLALTIPTSAQSARPIMILGSRQAGGGYSGGGNYILHAVAIWNKVLTADQMIEAAYGMMRQTRVVEAVDWWLRGGIDPADVIAVYQPKGAADLAASYVNLANPGVNDAAPGVAPTFDPAYGWSFNGTTQWLDTGILPTETTSALVQYQDVTTAAGVALGSYSGNDTTRFGMYARVGSGYHAFEHGGHSGNIGAYEPSSASLGVAGQRGYRDGIEEDYPLPAWSGTATATIGIAKQNGGSAYGQIKIRAVAIYRVTLTAAQMKAVAQAMAVL